MICLKLIQKFYNMTNLSTYRKKKKRKMRSNKISIDILYLVLLKQVPVFPNVCLTYLDIPGHKN